MRIQTNNIKQRLSALDKLITKNTDITAKYVSTIYHSYLENSNVPSDWGEKRRQEFFKREYFYTAVNLLKKKFLLNDKRSSNIKEGYVYFLAHPRLGGVTKIGSTIDIHDRLGTYNTGCPRKEYKILYYFFSSNRRQDEATIHSYFDANRLEGEWFDIYQSRNSWEKIVNSMPSINKIG